MDTPDAAYAAGNDLGRRGHRVDIAGGGEPFERCRDGLPDRFDGNIDTHTLVADGPAATFAGPDGALYCSADSGRTWQRTLTGLSTVYALLIRRRSG